MTRGWNPKFWQSSSTSRTNKRHGISEYKIDLRMQDHGSLERGIANICIRHGMAWQEGGEDFVNLVSSVFWLNVIDT